MRVRYLVVLSCLLLGLVVLAAAQEHQTVSGDAQQRYRQLSLTLLVSAGLDASLLRRLEQVFPAAGRSLSPEEVTTPLARIVDQQALLEGATQLFLQVREDRQALRAQLDQMEAEQQLELTPAFLSALSEDTIVVRNALADAMVYASLGEDMAASIQAYRAHTVMIRNTLEFNEFQAELDRLTGEAIASVGGKLDAYQRMFDDELNTGNFDRRIRSAELIYLPEGQFDPRAGVVTEEMMRNMILLESQPHR